METYLTRLTEIKHLTLAVTELHFQLVVPELVEFRAGQSMQISVAGQFKSYSIASAPGSGASFLIFCIEANPGSPAAAWLGELKIGDTVQMRGPEGNFFVDTAFANLTFVANGIGVTPFASIITDLLTRHISNKVSLLFESVGEEDFFYYDKFYHLKRNYENFNFVPMLTSPKSYWPGEVGHVTTYLESFYEKYRDSLFFLAGYKDKVMEINDLLLKLGHNPQNIKTEIFN